MFKYPIYKQDDEVSCGAYCIKMIMKYYKQTKDISKIKQLCRIDEQGITIYGLIKCFKAFNVEAKSYSCDLDSFLKETSKPSIVLTKENNLNHYLVYYTMIKDRIVLGDPAKGLRIMYIDEFEKIFMGITVSIIHVGIPTNNDEDYQTFNNFLLSYLKKNYKEVMKVISYSTIISILSLLCSLYFRLVSDYFKDYSFIVISIYTLGFIGIYLIRELFNYKKQDFSIQIKQYLDEEYIIKVVKDSIYLPVNSYNGKAATFLTRANSLMNLSEFFISFYQTFFMDGILLISVLIMLGIFNLMILLTSIILLVIVCGVILLFYFHLKRLNQEIVERNEMLSETLNEMYDNILNIKQYSVSKYIKSKIHYKYFMYFTSLYNKLKKINRSNFMIASILQTGILIIMLVSLYLFKQKSFTIGDVIMIYMLVSYLIEPTMKIIDMIMHKDEMNILYERYKQLLPGKIEKKKKIKKVKSISFEHITYSYGFRPPIIEGLDYTINKSIFLKGEVASGKTSLCKLIMGYDSVVKGKVKINNIDIQDIDNKQLSSKMTYLDKTPIFFNESLRFNLSLDKYDEDKMLSLLKYFDLDNLINRLDEQIDVSGGFLSSGQQQIIILIRAILKDGDVLILDESLSNLDDGKVNKVLEYLDKYLSDKIIILVSHQINIMKGNFDCVIMDSGLIKEE
ncbi:MAG: cysteine peptidase family C39 domain-containing protein [Thomasclavelia sp.]|nr:cysteine peptidase family C39 domain-containing protein [Thomasclavelia sp.]